jgi:hypothetical protein
VVRVGRKVSSSAIHQEADELAFLWLIEALGIIATMQWEKAKSKKIKYNYRQPNSKSTLQKQ